jgi:Raf kinase inhibitor-like YbhB/YbcL family protein
MTLLAAAVLTAALHQPSSLADEVVTGRVAAARDLIARGADVNEADDEEVTPLMRAASAGRGEMVRLLLDKGARINATTKEGSTALMMACLGGYMDAAATLLGSRADATLHDSRGRTALMAAAASGNEAIVDAVLRAGADPNAVDASGGTALTYAAAAGHAAAVLALEKRGAKAGGAEMLLAAAGCHTSLVDAFLASGLPANPRPDAGSTPLHAAAGNNCVETARLLADRGADLNARDRDGWTPLIKASQAGHVEIVRVLLQKGADMTLADGTGRTAWMYAAMGNYLEIAELFKQARGATVREPVSLEIGSPTLRADQPIPRDYTADGHNVSPPLTWSGVPTDTKSFAVICEDPDAGNPPPFVHWVIYNIPAGAKGLPEGVPFEPGAPMPGEIAGAVQGVSGFRRPIYRGPAPPPGKPHHYHFVVYALDITGLKPSLTRAELLEAIKGHMLATGELVAIYERKP